MWLIAGLGNPGPKYELTRHNCGFLVIDELARRTGREVRTAECQALTARATIGGQALLLVKPQTFMNLSGTAVSGLMSRYQVADPTRVLVISDDLALPFGRIRIRRQGSAGGHNGLKSMIARLNTQEFPRIRMGIAPEHPVADTASFVLAEFPRKDREALKLMVETASDAIEDILTIGIADAMSKYN